MTRRGKAELQAVSEARDWLNWFLAAIARGELPVASDLMARLEGAVAAIDALDRMTPAMSRGGLWSGVRRQPDALFEAHDRLRTALE